MITIWKYDVPLADKFEIPMPAGAQPRLFSAEQGSPMVWMEVDTDHPTESKPFRLVGTGHDFGPVSTWRWVGSCHHGPFVWHLLEVIS